MSVERWLEFDCNYGCGQKITADLGDYGHLKNDDGQYPKNLVFIWLGKAVWEALGDHIARCPVATGRPEGRPWLTLVKS